MSETITKWKWFDVMQYEEEAEYLHEMHLKGWEFAGVGGFEYTFKKCEPADVIYQLDYSEEADKHPDDYIQMYKDCGWEYICAQDKYQYFRKPKSEMAESEDGIFSDNESRMDMLKRVFKGRVIPLILVMATLCINASNNQRMTDGPFEMVIYILIYVLIAFYIVMFVRLAIHYRRLKSRIS